MSDQTFTYTLRGTTYSYQKSGRGQPIVFLHGFTGSKATWGKIMEELSRNFTVLAIDLPGHGTTVFEKPLSIEDCCADLVHLFNHLCLTDIHLVGYSMGGRIA